MSGSVIYIAIDLTDGFYQILMRESDIPLMAVSTPSGMLWEWLVMSQGLKNAPATFNRMVSHVLRPLRAFAPSYFDDIFVHSRAEDGLSAVDVHLRHLHKVFEKMRENKLYANLKKCVFCAPEIPVLGCYPTPKNQTELRQWLGLANYLHKYTKGYAVLIQPLSSLLKKDVAWNWRPEHQDAFDAVKKSLASAPVSMLPDPSRPFHVVCNASDFAIGCALMQFDAESRERVVSYQSRQMKSAETNYPVHDKELLLSTYLRNRNQPVTVTTQSSLDEGVEFQSGRMSRVGSVAAALARLTVPNRDTTPCARRLRSGNEMCYGPNSQDVFVCGRMSPGGVWWTSPVRSGG
ncbi:hypothetical protein PR003_g26714 [Phytophthora rubi]|uniref:Reverse transcriptase domain-containing protein n=1 Tax=Phytophthora rubi TaxID=129364 RepID=A0A6A4C8A5_9STRA|nr:hypothetical protein PR003_g26714 [Phytophthora rubi]